MLGLILFATTPLLNIAPAESETAMNWRRSENIEQNIEPLYPDLCCPDPCGKFLTRLDFLYWLADEDGLEYGTKMVATESIDVFSTTDTRLLDLDYEWDPGFRLGFGYLMNSFDSWALNVNWTHIHNHAHGKTTASGIEGQITATDTIIPIWVSLLFEPRWGAVSGSAHWHLDYDTLDIELGKSLCLGDRFVFNPYFGLRGALIDQDYRVNYNCVFILEEGAPTFNRIVNFKGDNDYKAFGVRGGSEMVYRLTNTWHLFSQLSANLLYGQFRVKMKNLHDQGLPDSTEDFDNDTDIPPFPTDFHASQEFWRVRLNFEEVVGFGWERLFRSDQYRLCFRAAFEMSQWLNQNQLYSTLHFRAIDAINLLSVRSQGDLSFMGLRVSGQFDF